MSRRPSAKERLEEKADPVLEEVNSPSVDRDEKEKQQKTMPPRKKNKKEKDGLNWSGILLLAMFCIPMIVAGVLSVMDYLDPEGARVRQTRQPLEKCYNAANPSKVDEIDYIMKKYQGREQRLFAQLRTKYGEKHPECQIWPPH